MTTEKKIEQLNKINRLAKSIKLERLINNPLRYTKGMLWKEIVYPITQKTSLQNSNTFFGTNMKVLLPAGMDIYLLGAKSHDSEIRLAKWLVLNLTENQTFIDVGAHFGYFTLLAAHLVGDGGKVAALEPSPNNFELLKMNTNATKNIQIYPLAASEQKEVITFYEFPTAYSEYNTLNAAQFENEDWFKQQQPKPIEVQATTLDAFFQTTNLHPNIIKMDIEGAEIKALKGMRHSLTFAKPNIVIEFSLLNQAEHQEAVNYLQKFGYSVFCIQKDGTLTAINNLLAHLKEKQLESENFVLQKV